MAEWLQNPLVVIGIAIGIMFFGYFFGLFEGRGQGYKKRQKEEAEDKKQRPSVEPLPPASPAAPSDEVSVLDVSMAPDGGLRLSMDGQRMDASALDAEQRKRLVAILTQMRPWLEAPKSVQTPAQARPVVSSPQEAPPTKAMPASTPSLSSKPTRAPSPASKPADPATVEEDEPSASPESIVAQIDSVLQARLVGTPLADRGIRLKESPEGGVLVWVGVSKYEGIDDVPDEQIKATLRAAIAEWEDKYTPGN